MQINFGICFSQEFVGDSPLSHIGVKLPVYLRLLDLCRRQGWGVYVLTRRTYFGNGVFNGVWQYQGGLFTPRTGETKVDLVYDRTGGVQFPPANDSLKVVNRRDFKILAWDKYQTYRTIGKYMPKTVWLKDLVEIKTDWVAVKPYNGLKGKGVYVGPRRVFKEESLPPGKKYIVQEFVDTSAGIYGLAPGIHDLRVVVVNGGVVWCHIRIPAKGKMLANRAQGGTLTEVNYAAVPQSVKKIVKIISEKFYQEYNNPIFSLDFGIDRKGKPWIFEINDLIGFPRWEMKNRDKFLNALVENFKLKITSAQP